MVWCYVYSDEVYAKLSASAVGSNEVMLKAVRLPANSKSQHASQPMHIYAKVMHKGEDDVELSVIFCGLFGLFVKTSEHVFEHL